MICKLPKGYIGETDRTLSTRMRGQRVSITKGNEKSARSTRNLRTGHTFDWDHVEVVDTEPMRDRRKVTETIHARVRKADINRELGYDLPPIYVALLREEGN